MIISIIFFFPVAIEYVETGLVPRFPTLIVSGLMVVAAVMSVFAGQILITIKHKERREFEFRLQEIDRWYKNLVGVEHK